ncbi:MAG: FkbM family methyltransferase [Ilumatobacter sp.]
MVELLFSLVDNGGIDGFIEAGAKDGGASSRAVSEFGLSNVVAFEANPYTHKRFNKRLVKAGVKHEHLALSETSGTVQFLVRLKEDGTPIADGQGSLLVRSDHTPGYESVSVEAVTLDGYYADDMSTSFAMWVDVEGASSQVLRGATMLLERTDLVFIEVEDRHKWDGQEWLHDDVVTFFVEHGLNPVARDTQSRHQFNVLFVSDRALAKSVVANTIAAWRNSLN